MTILLNKEAYDKAEIKIAGDSMLAWDILSANFKDDKGFICRKDPSYIPTSEDFAAIDCLCYEWDYAYEGNSPNGTAL